MHSTYLNVVALGLLSSFASVDAYWRMGCPGTLVTERLDPIIDPGKVSGHTHIILGGNAFAPNMQYSDTQKSTCTSCSIKGDLSNYWIPTLYYAAENGTFTSVPVSGGTVYYQQRVSYPGKKLMAFPAGLRMTAGNPELRAFNGTIAQKAISHACLNYAGGAPPQGPALPTVNCPQGVRAQVYFPSCWDGVNLDSSDHQSHMSYPTGDQPDSGVCPDSHPNPLISIFYEFIFGTGDFANEWYGNQQPFVYSMGDRTGYGLHGDFINGWDIPTLQNAVDNFVTIDQGQADNVYYNGYFSAPAVMGTACSIPPVVDEPVTGNLPNLPGCMAVGETMSIVPGCTATTTLGQDLSGIFTDVSKTLGWAYMGCGTDTYGNPALTGPVQDTQTMTVEMCIGLCGGKGYSIAGLEYGSQCFCGNSVPARAMPIPGSVGACTERCKGNSTEICGNGNALSLYQKCNGACNNAQFGLGGSGSSGSAPAAPVASSAVVAPASSAAGYSITSSAVMMASSVVTAASSAPVVSVSSVADHKVTPVNPIATATAASPVLPGPTVVSSPPASNVTLPAGWTSAGCYSDAVNPRSLSGISFAWWGEAMTSSGCAAYCSKMKYSMAGTENGGQCFCGNSLVKSKAMPSTSCKTACAGDKTQVCGGPGALSVFKSASAKPMRRRGAHKHRRGADAHAHHFEARS